MKTKITIRYSVLTVLVASTFGCTHVMKQPIHTVGGYPPAAKHTLKVQLILSDELKKSQWEHKSMGDTWQIPLGENLLHNAEIVARGIFADVVVHSTSNAPAGAALDATLAPRVVSVEQSMGVWKGSQSTFTLSMEWGLKDMKGDPVWIQTLQGEAKGKMGNAFSGKKRQEERVQMVLQDLFRKSFQAMATAPEIKDFVKTRQR